MNEKQFYTSPEVDVLMVQTEGVICKSGQVGINDWQNGNSFPTDF